MGWIVDHGKRKYRIKETVGHRIENGVEKPVVKTWIASTKKEAEGKRRQYYAEKEKGVESKRQYFGVLADRWLDTVFVNEDLAVATKKMYRAAWDSVIRPQSFYNLPLQDVTAMTIQEAFNENARTGGAPTTLKRAGDALRKFYDWVEKNDLYKNVGRLVTVPKPKQKRRGDVTVWTDEEIAAILGNFDKADKRFRLRFLLVLAYFTGARIGELLALRYDDISAAGVFINKQVQADENGALIVKETKTAGSVRTVPIDDPRVFRELEMHKAWHAKEAKQNKYPLDYIFTTETGTFYDKHNITRAAGRYYERIGIELNERTTFHTFRHTFGSNLANRGVPIEYASRLMGHDSIETTSQYYLKRDAELSRKYVGVLSQGLASGENKVVQFNGEEKWVANGS